MKNFNYQDVSYKYNSCNNTFETMYEDDLHLFVIWSQARSKEKEIIDELHNKFQILECFEIFWTQEYMDDNFHRMYNVIPNGGIANKRKEVGGNPFIVVVIKDISPNYLYRFDASERLKIVNSNVVDKKHLFRDWTGGGYLVHSTDNLKEFFNNAVLLFGKDKVFQLIKQRQWNEQFSTVHSDLIGANGWKSYEALFEVLNLTTEYVVLRGADYIENTDKILTEDVDILCADLGEFTSVANAKKFRDSTHLFHVNIDGREVLFDIRHIGDNYYDETWQKNIIKNKILNKIGVYVPRPDDYFFSLLYHAYIQKPKFNDKYIDHLTDFSEKIGIKNFKSDYQNNADNILRLLRGYLLAHNYQVSTPKDKKVFINVEFVSKLQEVNAVVLYLRIFRVKIKTIPTEILLKAKSLIKKNKILFNFMLGVREKYNKFIRGKS